MNDFSKFVKKKLAAKILLANTFHPTKSYYIPMIYNCQNRAEDSQTLFIPSGKKPIHSQVIRLSSLNTKAFLFSASVTHNLNLLVIT